MYLIRCEFSLEAKIFQVVIDPFWMLLRFSQIAPPSANPIAYLNFVFAPEPVLRILAKDI